MDEEVYLRRWARRTFRLITLDSTTQVEPFVNRLISLGIRNWEVRDGRTVWWSSDIEEP